MITERFVSAGPGVPLAHLAWQSEDSGAADAAPLAVLLHGVGGSRQAWNDAASGLGAALAQAGWPVAAVDLPGYGASPPLAEVTLATLAAAVEALVLALRPAACAAGRGSPGGLLLVGHSLGGMLAQEIAVRGVLQPAALVLANTSPAFGRPDGDWQRGFLRERFAPLDAGLGMAGLAQQLVPSMVAPDCTPERIAAAQQLLAAVPEATYRATLAALVGFDRRAVLPGLAQPALVLTGEHDRTAPPEVARRMAEKMPAAGFELIAGAGHLANIERPAAFNQAVIAFLARRGFVKCLH